MPKKKMIPLLLAMTCCGVMAQTAASPPLWEGPKDTTIKQNLGVRGGTATIDVALAMIVPAPYKVQLDDSIPKSVVLTWVDSPDWMSALKQAVSPMGYFVVPNWSNNSISVSQAVAQVPAVIAPSANPTNAAPAVISGTVAASQQPAGTIAPKVITPVEAVIAKPASTWKVELKDVYIANTLQRWASGHGWRVKWDASKHFVIDVPDVYEGSFEDAVTALLSAPGIQNSRYPVDVCFYPNTPPLARVTLRGDQDKECK